MVHNNFKQFLEAVKTYEPTHIKNKPDIVSWEHAHLLEVFPPPRKGILYGVVGNVDGFERHMEQFSDLGYNLDEIYLFENKEDMWKPLFETSVYYYGREWALRHCISGDILGSISPSVTHIDYDVTGPITHGLLEAEEAMSRNKGIESMVVVGTSREPYLSEELHNLDLWQAYSPISKQEGEGIAWARRALYYILNGESRNYTLLRQYRENYSITFQAYSGAGGMPMVSFILARGKNHAWPDPQENIKSADKYKLKGGLKLSLNIMRRHIATEPQSKSMFNSVVSKITSNNVFELTPDILKKIT
tara:strand:+ start:266 stop:1177 length:912 start_codon:yes stop_codon:yes gene_type:complete